MRQKKNSLPDHADQTVGSADRPFGPTGNQFAKLSTNENSPPKHTQKANNNQITVAAPADNMMPRVGKWV